jgi:hypothetical protein
MNHTYIQAYYPVTDLCFHVWDQIMTGRLQVYPDSKLAEDEPLTNRHVDLCISSNQVL